MDPELHTMLSFERFRSPVECLLAPLLNERVLVPMPCKHGRTFEMAHEARRQYYDEMAAMIPTTGQTRCPRATATAALSASATRFGKLARCA